MEPVSRSSYCGGACHEMNVSYQTWELTPHGANAQGLRAECIDCHLPPREHYFRHVAAKAWAGGKDMYMHYFGPEYDRQKMRQVVLDHLDNDTCTHCHKDLLKKPSDAKARLAHQAAAQNPTLPENKCTACHESAGHERGQTLFPVGR